jgi:hypothetical protein
MRDFIQHWAPLRASLAFDDRPDPVRSLANGWFKSLRPSDRLWLLSRTNEGMVLVLRSEIATSPQALATYPRYAVGNSLIFNNYRVGFRTPGLSSPAAVPVSLRDLRRLRFEGRSRRVTGTLGEILEGPLASMRRVHPSSVDVLESLWSRAARYPWKAAAGPTAAPKAVDLKEVSESRRIEVSVSRIVRDTRTVRALKQLHANRCQICGVAVKICAGERYSEGHHLRPLGGPHSGPDTADNILIVCPNHHAQLDLLGMTIAPQRLRQHKDHVISLDSVHYHNRLVSRRMSPNER